MSAPVLIGGGSVAWTSQGEGAPALFLHGNPDTKETWREVFAALAGTPLRCLAPDLPGFGQSAPDLGPQTLERFAAWTGKLASALCGEEPLHLVVHDVGGFYGLPFVASWPERVASLTILNTLFWPDYRWHAFGRAWRTPLLGELVMACANRWVFRTEVRRGSRGFPRELAEEAYARVTPTTRRTVLRLYRAMDPAVFAPWEPRLLEATARVPTRVIWGERDPYIPARFASRFGTDRIERLPEVGHWPMVERPQLVAARVAEAAGLTQGGS